MKTSFCEKIKTLILIIFIISSMILTYRLWFADHNLFSIFAFFQQDKTFKIKGGIKHVYFPPKILLNTGESSHILVRPTYEEYLPLQEEAVKIIKKILSSKDYEIVDISKWNELLSSKSLLYGYETNLSTNLLAKLLNVQISYNNIPYIKEFIIVNDNTVSQNIKCYVKDEEQNKIFSVKFRYDDSNLSTLLSQVEKKNFDNFVTGYELKHNLLRDDVLILPADTVLSGKKVKLLNEVNLDSSNEVNNLAKYFFKKINVVKNIEYYKDNGKVIQKEFIDRKNILKIFSNGKIEYTSAEIPDKTQVDTFSALKRAVEFIENNLGFPEYTYISEIKVLPESCYIFSFDYFIEGLEVKLKGEGIPEHAIEIEVKGDVISSYKRYVKKYKAGKSTELDVVNLKAIDDAIMEYRLKTGVNTVSKSINDVKLVYLDDGTRKESYPYWYVKIGDEKFFVNSVDEEN